MIYGLMDCNNFFVSCERVFRPDLENRPVVVLSNNDGCVVSRSNEAKEMQIPMGLPYFRIREYDPKGLVSAFSSNYVLYADMSQRVMSILRDVVGDVIPYSIDESFFTSTLPEEELKRLAAELPRRIRKCTGIPVSIGLAPTKTLAKMACKFAKKYKAYKGFCAIDNDQKRQKAASLVELKDVWGIGRRTLVHLNKAGFKTALDFTNASEAQVRKLLGLNGLRTWHELRGDDSIEAEDVESKKSICTSRSFADMVCDLDALRPMVANFASMCAVKLRKQRSVASIVSVYVATNFFRDDMRQYSNVASVTLPVAASSQIEIVRAADKALQSVYVKGLFYKKAGVLLSGITPDHALKLSLFHHLDENKRNKMNILSGVVDNINRTEGINTIHLASQMTMRKQESEGALPNASNSSNGSLASNPHNSQNNVFLNNLRREHISPRYSTDWNEIITVH